ncbi:hypothetical protein GH810_03560 [Acetobacterium paludosum]|uniref:ABM domain-containing protein n=1 Tax=Acetobacterium paludosum TaxID=52693 RepID=A0A923I1I2_9FIRM|nr:hypothetical protein [Acetobacterium paludosum]
MNSQSEFNSEFCNVRYMESDNVVLLTWKKFARINDYREPTHFALQLLQQHPQSNFVVDARNGFEDDPEDVKWGFSELLPSMAKTDCQFVILIMEKAAAIEDEMDMWTKELGKYFAVIKVQSYQQAIRQMKDGLLVNVRYTVKPGKRNAFLEETSRQGIISESRTEPGNIKYEYYIPVESENDLFLMEMWVSSEAQAAHGKTAHYKMLQALKEEYITAITIEKYHTSAISN